MEKIRAGTSDKMLGTGKKMPFFFFLNNNSEMAFVRRWHLSKDKEQRFVQKFFSLMYEENV